MEFARGTIVSIVAGFYFIEKESCIYPCRARGRLRLDGRSPMVGDEVLFSPGEEGLGALERVLPRRNFLLRPAIANLDAAVAVLSPQDPSPVLFMVDKLLAQILFIGLKAIVCVNKTDLDPPRAQALKELYSKSGFSSLCCSALTGQGLKELASQLSGCTAVLAGQSGVGKSHISSRIALEQPELPILVGGLSPKMGRGKHTTRQSSLLSLPGGGKIADTPGFSVFTLEVESQHLHRYYPEFVPRAASCRFSPCYHIHEPDCAVKDAQGKGEIDPGRYDNYVKIYTELQQKEAERY